MLKREWMLSCCLFGWICLAASAQAPAVHTPLIIGTKEAPPFAMKGTDGRWTGISIELWRNLAAKLKLEYQFKELDLQEMLSGVQSNSLDAAISAITVTSDRERVMDFTHPFYMTGLSIAVAPHGEASWLTVLRKVLSREFLAVIATLGLLLLSVGFLIWLFERRRNSEQFGGKPLHGIGSGLWWSAVTMTTVGYGDKAPQTVPGRIIALIWMFAGIIVISSFTAAIASALTVSQLGSSIRGPGDLPRVRVAAVNASTGEQYLKERHISYRGYPDALSALRALSSGLVDAVVYDAPILRYLTKKDFPGSITVLPHTFVRQDYAIAVPQGSPLRETLDRVLEGEIHTAQWQEVLYHYLGSDE